MTIPLSASERSLQKTGIGRLSGYWRYNADRRRALGAYSESLSAHMTSEPVMVWPVEPPQGDAA